MNLTFPDDISSNFHHVHYIPISSLRFSSNNYIYSTSSSITHCLTKSLVVHLLVSFPSSNPSRYVSSFFFNFLSLTFNFHVTTYYFFLYLSASYSFRYKKKTWYIFSFINFPPLKSFYISLSCLFFSSTLSIMKFSLSLLNFTNFKLDELLF